MLKNKNIQLPLDLFPKSAPKLGEFIVGENSQAFAAVSAIAKGEGTQFVYLFGQSGTGKTFLLRAASGDKAQEAVPVFNPNQKLYVVDNVQKLSDEDLEKLFDLANNVRANPGTSLLAAGDKSPTALKNEGMRDDVTSRLAWGAVFELVPLTEEQRYNTFVKEAEKRGMEITPEVISWVKTYLPRDMRTLKWLFEGLDGYSLAKKRKLTIPLIKEWLDLVKYDKIEDD